MPSMLGLASAVGFLREEIAARPRLFPASDCFKGCVVRPTFFRNQRRCTNAVIVYARRSHADAWRRLMAVGFET